MPQSDLCDYSVAYIVIKGNITVEGTNNRDKHNINLVLKNSARFISCVSKINGTLIENAEDLVMRKYKILYRRYCNT